MFDSPRRPLIAVVVAALVAGSLSACLWERRVDEGLIDDVLQGPFYELPDDLPAGDPGELIRSEPIPEAKDGTQAWRVIYHSQDITGADIPVSGVIVVPHSPAPEGGRVVVGWAHPTTGAAASCAPSRGPDPFLGMEGLDALLLAGFAVAATDYPGLGVEGTSSYLLGVPESNAVLDAVRAARHIDDVDAGDRLVLWGHSQGGQAALFAGQRVAEYAPELDLQAVAVAAPAADLNALMSDDIADISGVTIASYAIPAYRAAYSDRYGQDAIDAILTPAGLEAVPKVADLCLETQQSDVHAITGPLVGGFTTADPATTEPWASMLLENSAGASPIGVPMYVGQGLADQLVIPTATEGYVSRLCAAGETVLFEKFDGATHALAAYASLPTMLPWLEGVLAGDSESNCPTA